MKGILRWRIKLIDVKLAVFKFPAPLAGKGRLQIGYTIQPFNVISLLSFHSIQVMTFYFRIPTPGPRCSC